MTARPDVALVSLYPPLGSRHAGTSGVASYAANLAHALSAAGLSVTVVAPLLDGEPAVGHDGDVRVERCFPLGPGAVPAALRAARATGAPVAHLQHELFLYGGPSALPGLAAGLGRRRGQPVVVTAHQVVDVAHVDADYRRMHRIGVPVPVARRGIALVQATLSKLADAVVVHEPAFAELLPGARVVPHGVEQVTPLDRRSARAQLGLDDRLVVLCFGFLAPYKGLELAGEAALSTGVERVHLVLAGGEHPRLAASGDDYASRLARRFGEVATLTGHVPEPDVATWFSAADVALLPYPRPHAASGALALALAYGTPALLSPALVATTGAPQALTAPTDPGLLGERLHRLAADPADRSALSDATAELAAGRSWAAVAQAHRALYEEVVHRVQRTARRSLRAA